MSRLRVSRVLVFQAVGRRHEGRAEPNVWKIGHHGAMTSRSRDRWIGAIPYFPSDSRLWIRGPAGALKPNAARPLGVALWVVIIGLLVCGLLLLTSRSVLRLAGAI